MALVISGIAALLLTVIVFFPFCRVTGRGIGLSRQNWSPTLQWRSAQAWR